MNEKDTERARIEKAGGWLRREIAKEPANPNQANPGNSFTETASRCRGTTRDLEEAR